ncbi:intracellular protein transport protein USO1-like [Arachis duranensis]|uniref:Intracellular protein transport protein USO1-like n=1 Tax=Arachis duranensis TaxID=130453 RepID=A0A6P4CR32_ARADU|nr:intracellular protein transport protein USO1-like [Arachis duranensis]
MEMSASVTGLPNLFQTFLCASDDEGDNEKSAAEKSAIPPEDKTTSEQEAVVDGTGTSTQAAQIEGDKTVHASPFREVIGTGGSTSTPDVDDGVEEVPNPKRKRKMSSSPEGVLTVMERNFDAGNFIDSQLIPGTEEYFHESSLAGQARWMYRTLLRGAVIARKAEFELSGMESLRRRLESSGKANNELKSEVETLREQLTQLNEKLDAAEKKATAAEKKTATAEKKLKDSDATVSRLVEREMTLESQVGAAQKRVAEMEKEKQAVEAELATWKAKYKDVVKQGKGAILATEEALKAQVKVIAPEFDTSAIGVLKVIQDGKVVDVPKK